MIENRIREHREKENMLKCLELADKGKNFEIQKNNKIMMMREQKEHKELTTAELLKRTLTKSKKSYQNIKKQRSETQNNNLQKMANTPEINKLKSSSTNNSPATPVINRSEPKPERSKVHKDNQSNIEMLVQMRQRLIKNLTDRDEKNINDQSHSKTRLINPQTERIGKGYEVKSNFMSVTESKKQ